MNEDDANTIDAISQIKGKLTKYSQRKPDPAKVNEYLNMLSNYTVNAAICKSTDIYKFLKDLKKKENPSYSKNAADLMLKWKKQLTASSVNSTDDSNCKYDPTPINANKEQEQEKLYNPSAKSPKSNSSESSSTKSSKKRLSETTKPYNSGQEKKPKISLNDYKSKKTSTATTAQVTEFDMFDAKSNHSENSNDSNQVSGGSCKYGFDDLTSDDENTSEKYSPTPIAKSQSKKSTSKEKNMIQPPKPSTSLKDILENSKQLDSYVPTSVPKAPVNLPRSATSVRPSANATPYVPSMQRSNSASQESVDEALSRIMKQKQGKRVLYTGKKSEHAKVPVVSSLYNICARNLVDNLDTLPSKISIYNMTHDFAIAFELLRPVLEKANAKQLENIENYSPHLLSDTDYIWKKISEQEFKKIEAPDEDESWRELYFKKYDAREQQFLRARSIVSKMQKDKPQERVTKMATLKPAMKVISHFPKAYQNPANNVKKQSAYGFTKSAPSNVIVKEPKPTPGYMRAPPVMSRGMRETIKMLKVRRK